MLSAAWLHFSKIEESKSSGENAGVVSCLKLLEIGYVLLMVLGIFFLVGIDVGINAASGQFLMEKLNMSAEPAKQGRSLYFFGKMLGTFLGALLLTKFASNKVLLVSSLLTLLTIVVFMLVPNSTLALIVMFSMGLSSSNIFPLIFSLSLKKYPTRANEISGLIIMAVSGGAIIPPIIGGITDISGIIAGWFVLIFCAIYLVFVSFYAFKKTES